MKKYQKFDQIKENDQPDRKDVIKHFTGYLLNQILVLTINSETCSWKFSFLKNKETCSWKFSFLGISYEY